MSYGFAYSPAFAPPSVPEESSAWLLATAEAHGLDAMCIALRRGSMHGQVESLLERHPLFWYRLELAQPHTEQRVRSALSSVGIQVRYVTPPDRGDQRVGPPLTFSAVQSPARDNVWPLREPAPHREEASDARWFLDDRTGIAAVREVCGFGAGIRVAVIDDDAGHIDTLGIEEPIVVAGEPPHSGSAHGAAMVAWAVGSRGRGDIPAFVGVAPDASPRLYLMPKPEKGVAWLPLAIARAVFDGADVIVCATYVDGLTSPLLDDALELAVRSGRGGLGTAVLMPSGREISSPPGSVSASLTLRLGDPASDPRVLCVGPSGRDGGWFLWRDKHGRLRPFANRGPAVRATAPGDDIAYPFAVAERLGHAESSGASATAAGVATLVLSKNPELTSSELFTILTRTARQDPTSIDGPIADRADLLPLGTDADGHNARCGYGRLSASRACLSVRDPVSAALIAVGEDHAARAHVAMREKHEAYSEELGSHFARWMLSDTTLDHMVRTCVRHLRLVAHQTDWQTRHGTGSLLRMLVLLLRHIERHRIPDFLLDETRALAAGAGHSMQAPARLENRLLTWAASIFPSPAAEARQSPPENREDRLVGAGRHSA